MGLLEQSMASRRMSVCLEDTKHNNKGKILLCVAECASLATVLMFWGYFMFAVLRPNSADHINLFGITFYKGSSYHDLLFNLIIYYNFFSITHILFMLSSKKSNQARAICGYNNVDPRQSTQMTILTAIYFNAVLSSTCGLGDFYPVAPVSMAVTTIQATSFYLLSGQFLYSLFFRHT